MDLTGADIFAKKGRDFTAYHVEWVSRSGDGLTVALSIKDAARSATSEVSVPRRLFQPQDMTAEDYVRLAVVVLRDLGAGRNPEGFVLDDADVRHAKDWQTVRPQTDVVRDVLSLVCEATIAGLCVPGKELHGISVLASVKGTCKQVYQAIEFLVQADALGQDAAAGIDPAITALQVNDFWTTVKRLGDLKALQSGS